MGSFTSLFNYCVTCQNWDGPRKLSHFRDRVEYKNNQDKGECIGGGYNGTQQTAVFSCSKYVKWSLLI